MKQIHTVNLMLAGLLLIAAGSAQAVVVGWGAATSNTIASNCPSFCGGGGTFTRNSDGGEFQTRAFSDVITSNGETEAESRLRGGGRIATPVLTGYSAAAPGAGAFSRAVGAQGYSYGGLAQTITLDLRLSAILDETAAGSRAQADARVAVIFANDLGFWTDFGTLVFEVAPPGSVADQTSMFANIGSGSRGLVRVNDSLTFDVLPGDEFLVWASLDVDAFRGGVADARNTFEMDFFDELGNLITDPTILAAESLAGLSEVPLPAGVWLFLSGVAVVGGLSRRRKASQTS